jgi:cobalt-zinc-cadmium efflux system membrane fusion protein
MSNSKIAVSYGVMIAAGVALYVGLSMSSWLAGSKTEGHVPDAGAQAPPPVQVETEADGAIIQVDHPEQFPLVPASGRVIAPELTATGVVAADVSRTVPVVSLASGRVVEVHARLGDTVTKGQPLVRVESTEVSAAFSDFRKASAELSLARSQLDRARLLFDKGATAQKDLEVAQNTAEQANVNLQTAADRIRMLGGDPAHPGTAVDILAPASGVITEQNVNAAGGVKTLDNSPNLFTIADLSTVWILCDVYENNLAEVHVGDTAEVRPNAYPDRSLPARVTNISPILDPAIRTAKVRLEIKNPGILRFGMFVSATFRGRSKETHTVVPAGAILHLHDRDWVYVPAGYKSFRRVEVAGGKMLPGPEQELLSGLKPGQAVVSNALVLQNTAAQ